MLSIKKRLSKLLATKTAANDLPLSLSVFYGQPDDGSGKLYKSLAEFYEGVNREVRNASH
ncbi:MAG: hypothetical protein Q7T96_18380 [Methylobacter sp.]|nr:hypothetical protein [Methylobacter sp.]